jgi:hypothetical protein
MVPFLSEIQPSEHLRIEKGKAKGPHPCRQRRIDSDCILLERPETQKQSFAQNIKRSTIKGKRRTTSTQLYIGRFSQKHRKSAVICGASRQVLRQHAGYPQMNVVASQSGASNKLRIVSINCRIYCVAKTSGFNSNHRPGGTALQKAQSVATLLR